MRYLLTLVAVFALVTPACADPATAAAPTGAVPTEVARAAPAAAPLPSAREIVERAEDALRGDTADMVAAMTITTPRWKRVVRFHSWDDRLGDRSFIRILEPKKDRGTGFLRHAETFWTYLPRVERTMRIPPSMMLQSWMGSDFTNDDLARDSSLIDDYEASVIGEKQIEGVSSIGVLLVPKEEAPVVWARVEIWLERARFAPLLYLYYDESEEGKFELVRRMIFSDVQDAQGRPMPRVWLIEPLDKPGHSTRIDLEAITLDEKFPDDLFTQKNLRRSEAKR